MSTWTLVPGDPGIGGFAIYDEADDIVATVPSPGCICQEHQQATRDHARRIAALPSLVQALRRIERMAEIGEPGISAAAREALAAAGWLAGSGAEDVARAHLNQAAPQMLDALRFVVRFHDGLTPADIARIRSIVDLATGRAS